MPTSSAVDVVAKELGIDCYETPTGWKFFGNLLDAGKILSAEKRASAPRQRPRARMASTDVLDWLQILAERRCSVAEIMAEHWKRWPPYSPRLRSRCQRRSPWAVRPPRGHAPWPGGGRASLAATSAQPTTSATPIPLMAP